MMSKFSIFLGFKPDFQTLKVNELQASPAFANLKQGIFFIKIIFPAQSAIWIRFRYYTYMIWFLIAHIYFWPYKILGADAHWLIWAIKINFGQLYNWLTLNWLAIQSMIMRFNKSILLKPLFFSFFNSLLFF